MKLHTCLCGLLALTTIPLVVSEDIVVTTKYGAVRGKRVSTGESSYLDEFYGIPYAVPPVGPLRFRPPQPIQKWNCTREALWFSPACPQIFPNASVTFPTSEDCLYLNIYAPKPPPDRAVVPVMVWIHGGSYSKGSGAFYNGSALAGTGVLVVTINYRLQVLGFLSTMDAASGGNFGLLDQIQALKWVKDTIISFHGDPNDITIFGESAGSSSVSLLLLSPLAKGLFSKAIMESGVSLCPWAVTLPTESVSPLQWALQLAKKVGCGEAPFLQGTSSTTRLVDCLRKVSADALVFAEEELAKKSKVLGIVFSPTVETIYGVVPDTPLKLMSHGAGSDVISIRGVNKDEYSDFFVGMPLSDFTPKNVKAQLLLMAQVIFPNHSQTVADKLFTYYFTAQNFSTKEQIRQGAIQVRTDFSFVVPTLLELRHVVHSTGHPASQFLYQFTYRATFSDQPVWAGVEHGSELPFVFGQPFIHDKFFQKYFPIPWSTHDKQVSLDVIRMWTNLAKFGNPTPKAVDGVMWWPYTMDKQIFLEIGSTLALHTRLESERMDFCFSLIKDYGGVWS